MSGQMVVNEDNLSQWIAGMKKVYQENLAQTYTLHVDGKDYPCNEAIMHAALPAFPAEQWNEIFSAVGAFADDGLVTKLLCFFYTFEITVCMKTLKPMLKASKVLNLTHLQKACQNYLWPYLQPQNYIGWLTFGIEEGLDEITQRCRDGVLNYLDNIIQCQEFQQLDLASVMELLEDQRGAGQSPDALFRAALQWIGSHGAQNGETLLDTFDITACSKDTLKKVITEPYKHCAWSVATQHKLFQACLLCTTDSCPEENKNVASAQTFKDLTKAPECSLDLNVPIVHKFAQTMHEAFKQFLPEHHADIVVHLSDRDVKAHQVVIVASPYFEAAMRNRDDHHSNYEMQQTDLKELDPFAVSSIIASMYSGKITVTDDKLLDYIFACDYLHLKNLLGKCRQQASMVEIKPDNCVQWLKAQNLLDISKLKEKVTKWMSVNIEKVCCLDGILDLRSDELLEVLESESVAEVSEKTLYETLIFWIKHDQDNRKVHLPQLLGSRAMKQSTVCENLDMPALLEAAAFNIEERDQVWDVHFKKMAKAFRQQVVETEDLHKQHVAEEEDLRKQHVVEQDDLRKQHVAQMVSLGLEQSNLQKQMGSLKTEQSSLQKVLQTKEWQLQSSERGYEGAQRALRTSEWELERIKQKLKEEKQKTENLQHNLSLLQREKQFRIEMVCWICLAIVILLMFWLIFKLCGCVLAWYYTSPDSEFTYDESNLDDNKGVCDRKHFYEL